MLRFSSFLMQQDVTKQRAGQGSFYFPPQKNNLIIFKHHLVGKLVHPTTLNAARFRMKYSSVLHRASPRLYQLQHVCANEISHNHFDYVH